MKDIIQIIEGAVSIPVVPLESNTIQEQVIYSITPVSDNGVFSISSLELNIIGNTLANAEQYDEAIRVALLNVGDSNKIENITNIEINGGGTLRSEIGVHRFTNYIINRRR